MKQKYNIVFNIDDRVKNKDLGIKGYVSGIYITKGDISYKVRYFITNEIKEIYFDERELELIDNEDPKLGFK